MNQKLLICFIIIIIVIFIVSNNSELFTEVSKVNEKAYTINLIKDGEKYDLFTFSQLTYKWKKELLKYISAIDRGSLKSVINAEELVVINKRTTENLEVMPTHDFVFAIKHKDIKDIKDDMHIINNNIVFNNNNDPIYSILFSNENYTNINKVLTVNNNILVATDKESVTTAPVILSQGNKISGDFIELIDFTIDSQSIFIIKLINTDTGVTITKT
jgi:hypothetical protein